MADRLASLRLSSIDTAKSRWGLRDLVRCMRLTAAIAENPSQPASLLRNTVASPAARRPIDGQQRKQLKMAQRSGSDMRKRLLPSGNGKK